MLSADIIEQARTWLGVRYRLNAAGKDGADCLGFVLGVAKELKVCSIAEPEKSLHGFCDFKYKISVFDSRFEDMLDRHLVRINSVELGCIVLIKVSGAPLHLAIITSLEPVNIIHAYVPARKIIEEVASEKLQTQFYKYYSFIKE